MMQKYLKLALVLLTWTSTSQAQMTGNPLLPTPTGKMTVAIESGYQRLAIQNVYNDIQPLGLKIGYAPYAAVNIFVRLGIARIKIPWGSTEETTFNGDFRFAGGIGLTLQPLNFGKRSGIFFNAQAWRLTTKGQYMSQTIAGTGFQQIRLSEFDWRHFMFATGFSGTVKKVKFYLGAEMAAVERIENRNEIVSDADTILQETQKQFTLRTGTFYRGFWGLEVSLPHNHHVSLEMRGKGLDDWMILLGLGQTGSPR